MNETCIHCGLPFYLYGQGFLFIKSSKIQLSHPFINDGESYWKAPYDSLEDLQYILLTMQQRLGEDFKSLRGALSSKEQRPFTTYPFKSLLARVINRGTVDIIQNGELVGFVQPIINLQDEQNIYAYESLLRTGGETPISPGKLFHTAEETGLLSLLDQRAREVAIKTRKEHIPNGIKSFINFLPSTIYNPDFCLKHTFHLVKKYHIDPADLVFEVVETEKIEDVDHLKDILVTYKREGIKVALDDLGAGFSTIEMLELLQPDYVKIDRHYIDHCDQDEEKQLFLSRVMNISKSLNITVLAEGIERAEELHYCKNIGVDLAQGYYIGKPALPGQVVMAGGK